MYKVNNEQIERYKKHLKREEKAAATIEKYIHDLQKMLQYTDYRISKELLIRYKDYLRNDKKYKISSINSFLAAINHFLKCMGWNECCIKSYRIQRAIFEPECRCLTKSDYFRLIEAAKEQKNIRLSCLLQTIGATGIRVSELRYVTVEGVQKGVITIFSKGKCRSILLPQQLQKLLLDFSKENGYETGIIFRTSKGNPINRSNVWKEMKQLARTTGINEEKIFPHNFRHLFAKTFYEIDHDLAKLSELLGHSSIVTT